MFAQWAVVVSGPKCARARAPAQSYVRAHARVRIRFKRERVRGIERVRARVCASSASTVCA
eukprot:208276-Pleurochrysis_carterae.AAC.21